MESNRIAIDPVLLTYVAQTLGRVPETIYDFQKIKNLACGGRPVYQKLIDPLHDPVPERIKIDFLTGHMEHVWEKDIHWRREFAFAVTAILGERNLAFMFFMSGMESCYIVCPGCENCDEEIEFGYFDPDERIEKVEVPAEKWDGGSLGDVKLWLFNLFALLDDTEGTERLCYYFGTYTCPECGEQTLVRTGMGGYFLSS